MHRSDYILKGKKGKIVSPSQLDSTWLRQPKNIEVKNFKLLYVGRFKVEKGIFSLLNLIKNKKNISLTIIGAEKKSNFNLNQSNVKIHQTLSSKSKLIKSYDDHNIFVLPSLHASLVVSFKYFVRSRKVKRKFFSGV